MEKKRNPWTPEPGNIAATEGWYPASRSRSTSSSDQHSALTEGSREGSEGGQEAPTTSEGTDPNSSKSKSQAAQSRSDALEALELQAIVGAGTSFTGTLSFSGRVRIDGEFSGQAWGGRLLVIGEGARVQGLISAARVVILGGVVKADITAREGIELYVPCQVSGDLQAPEIHLDRGVRFQGTCDLSDPSPMHAS